MQKELIRRSQLFFALREDEVRNFRGVNFDLSGGACGREGRFLKKAPQKLFSRGQLYGASFLAEKLCFSASPSHIGKKESELSFFPMWLGPCGFFSLAKRIHRK